MPPAPSEISRDDLLAVLKREGFIVSPHQLLRWRNWGLLPQPRREGLGRGRGTVSYYPRLAVLQARTLMRLLQRDRDLLEAGWGLWMLGFPMTDWARDRLLAELEDRKREFARADRSLQRKGQLARYVGQRRAPKVVARMRKGMRPEAMPRILRMLVSMQLGTLRAEDHSDDDWALLQEASLRDLLPAIVDDPDLPRPDEVAAGMAKLSSEINLDRAISELEKLPDRRLEQYRNEVQWLYEVLSPPEERSNVLVSCDDFIAFFRTRHLNSDGERGLVAWMRALGQTRPPASSLQRWLAAARLVASPASLPTP